MKIKDEVFQAITDQIAKHLTDYRAEIESAVDKNEGSLSITLASKLEDMGNGQMVVQTSIGFGMGKVKDKWRQVVGGQMPLPGVE